MRLPRPAVPDEHSFSSRLRSPTVSARLGVAVGVCFGTAFLTGLLSHYAQLPDQPVPFPVDPVWGYRVTQGLHVISGTAAIPLLLVKLWTVFPKLFARPPRRIGLLVVEAAERVSIAVLVGAAITELATGVANVAQWYAWDFNFRRTHFALAWIVTGAMVLHIAVKLPAIRAALGVDPDADDAPAASATGLTRRGLLRAAWTSSAVAVLATGFGTVRGLDRVSVLSARSRDQAEDLPVNKSAIAAGVIASATSAAYRLVVSCGDREVTLSREQLLALPQHTEVLPIACVEGWTVDGSWTGPRIRELLDLVDASRDSDVVVHSLQQHGPDRVTTLQRNFARDGRTLLALALNGEPLALDHGFPARVIAPNRPGVLQTKWVAALEVLT